MEIRKIVQFAVNRWQCVVIILPRENFSKQLIVKM